MTEDELRNWRTKLVFEADRVHRLKALGNAIVPQVAIEIMRAIKQVKQL